MVEKHVFGPFAHGAPAGFARADLEFYRINHFRPSYLARIYLNDPDVDEQTATADRESFAGSFAIFGHRTCVGDDGHCEVHIAARRFDDRPSHPLTRAFKRVVVTDALRRCVESPELTVTVLVSSDPDDEVDGPLLDFDGLQLTTFV